MAMSSEVQAEYDKCLREAVLVHGTVVDTQASIYGWMDYDNWNHSKMCKVISTKVPYEDKWNEFAGTFYTGDTTKHGVAVDGVHCACGLIKDRTFRWEAEAPEMIEKVFTIAISKWVPGA